MLEADMEISQQQNAMNDAIKQVNEFFNTNWKDYRTKVENINISPFKDTKKF